MKFRVKSSITAEKEYLPGEVIELSPEQAAAMPWAVEALPVEKPAPVEAPKEKGKKG
jgi:hypothetical protein